VVAASFPRILTWTFLEEKDKQPNCTNKAEQGEQGMFHARLLRYNQ
jgi:hypothetical protein